MRHLHGIHAIDCPPSAGLDGGMAERMIQMALADVDLQAVVHLDEGVLRVHARRVDSSWIVRVSCGRWSHVCIGPELKAAADAALGPYAAGVSLEFSNGDR